MAVDARRAAQVAVALGLSALAIVSIVLFAAGAQKNSQIDQLRTSGVPVTMTVTRCLGLLGGSGSNEAGYACRGTYSFGGHRYDEAIPGNVNRAPRSAVAAVIAAGDPGLVSTLAAVRTERASWHVFVAPGVLALLFAAGVVALAIRTRKRRRATESGEKPARAPEQMSRAAS